MGFIIEWLKKLFGFYTTTTTTDSTTTKKPDGNKKALCIAINDYPGYNNDLKGCVNDAKNWSQLLQNKYGFTIVDTLLDRKATKVAVYHAIKKLVKQAKDGDILVITYSGHGTNVRDTSRDEADGRDEAWCMYDGNLIDDDIKKLIAGLPSGVKLTVISDSCHSGTVTRAFMEATNAGEYDEYIKARYMPPEDDIEAFAISSMPLEKAVFEPRSGMKEILISGCKSTEYSYDARINGQATGAFSYHAINILKNNPGITYEDFYKKLREQLPTRRFSQTPQLEGSEENKKAVMFE